MNLLDERKEAMTILVIVGALLLLAAAVVVVAWPLWQERRGLSHAELVVDTLPETDPLVELQEQRDAIYQAIRELRFDQQVGKVSETDYKAFDTQLRTQAARVLKQMDALQLAEADSVLDAALEGEISRLRHIKDEVRPLASRPAQSPDAQPQPAMAIGNGATANFCSQCGQRTRPGDRFCGACGAAL